MPTYDASSARCRVFTFKEGLLSAVAHDLEIDVTGIEIEVGEGEVVGRFDPRSLRVLCAHVDGRPSEGTISDRDKAKIESNIQSDVLRVKKHPAPIEFRSSSMDKEGDDRLTVRGALTLAGRAREVVVSARRDGEHWVSRVRLHQPDYGIKPYSAMLGTLKIKADVEVEVRIPVA